MTGEVTAHLLSSGKKAEFIAKSYVHLLGCIVAFILIELWFFRSGFAEPVAKALLSVSWLVVLGAYVLVAWFASLTAHAIQSRPGQYAALAFYVGAEAIIFVPLLYTAESVAPGTIANAAVVTVLGFCVLSAIVFISRHNFSFLRSFLCWGGLVALALIVASVLFKIPLGQWFSIAMVGYAGSAILYDTSRILHEYEPNQYVAAGLELFSSIALLFWYVIQLLWEHD